MNTSALFYTASNAFKVLHGLDKQQLDMLDSVSNGALCGFYDFTTKLIDDKDNFIIKFDSKDGRLFNVRHPSFKEDSVEIRWIPAENNVSSELYRVYRESKALMSWGVPFSKMQWAGFIGPDGSVNRKALKEALTAYYVRPGRFS